MFIGHTYFHYNKRPNIVKIISPSGHTVYKVAVWPKIGSQCLNFIDRLVRFNNWAENSF